MKRHVLELLNDLPVPAAAGSDLKRKWPFREMAVGQNFRVPPEAERKAMQAVRGYAERTPGWTFAAARDEHGVLRIWRKS